jgi:hypothetical protein
MIHYHGTPITPEWDLTRILAGRHAMVSYGHPDQLPLIADICQSFSLDNNAFSAWKAGEPIADWNPYYSWVRQWMRHPSFDFALIPDVVDGTEKDNDILIAIWPLGKAGCPIWHLHESLPKLQRLCQFWPRVAIGSSGDYATIGTSKWWNRMAQAMAVACPYGYPDTKLHGLRMLNPEVFSRFPFSSADSTNVGRNIGIDSAWRGTYLPHNKAVRGIVLAERIENTQSCPTWELCAIQEPLQFDLKAQTK